MLDIQIDRQTDKRTDGRTKRQKNTNENVNATICTCSLQEEHQQPHHKNILNEEIEM